MYSFRVAGVRVIYVLLKCYFFTNYHHFLSVPNVKNLKWR